MTERTLPKRGTQTWRIMLILANEYGATTADFGRAFANDPTIGLRYGEHIRRLRHDHGWTIKKLQIKQNITRYWFPPEQLEELRNMLHAHQETLKLEVA